MTCEVKVSEMRVCYQAQSLFVVYCLSDAIIDRNDLTIVKFWVFFPFHRNWDLVLARKKTAKRITMEHPTVSDLFQCKRTKPLSSKSSGRVRFFDSGQFCFRTSNEFRLDTVQLNYIIITFVWRKLNTLRKKNVLFMVSRDNLFFEMFWMKLVLLWIDQ